MNSGHTLASWQCNRLMYWRDTDVLRNHLFLTRRRSNNGLICKPTNLLVNQANPRFAWYIAMQKTMLAKRLLVFGRSDKRQLRTYGEDKQHSTAMRVNGVRQLLIKRQRRIKPQNRVVACNEWASGLVMDS